MNAQDLTEDEEAEAVDEDVVDDVTAEDEDDEAEVEDDENAELVSGYMNTLIFISCFQKGFLLFPQYFPTSQLFFPVFYKRNDKLPKI